MVAILHLAEVGLMAVTKIKSYQLIAQSNEFYQAELSLCTSLQVPNSKSSRNTKPPTTSTSRNLHLNTCAILTVQAFHSKPLNLYYEIIHYNTNKIFNIHKSLLNGFKIYP